MKIRSLLGRQLPVANRRRRKNTVLAASRNPPTRSWSNPKESPVYGSSVAAEAAGGCVTGTVGATVVGTVVGVTVVVVTAAAVTEEVALRVAVLGVPVTSI